MEDLKIKTVSVEIKVITVGGKKMTKAVYNQIQEEMITLYDIEISKCSILGYVNEPNGCKWLLWVNIGELRKMRIDSKYEDIINVEIETCKTNEVSFVLRDYIRVHNLGNGLLKDNITKEKLEKLKRLKSVAIAIWNTLEGGQIYIAT